MLLTLFATKVAPRISNPNSLVLLTNKFGSMLVGYSDPNAKAIAFCQQLALVKKVKVAIMASLVAGKNFDAVVVKIDV